MPRTGRRRPKTEKKQTAAARHGAERQYQAAASSLDRLTDMPYLVDGVTTAYARLFCRSRAEHQLLLGIMLHLWRTVVQQQLLNQVNCASVLLRHDALSRGTNRE